MWQARWQGSRWGRVAAWQASFPRADGQAAGRIDGPRAWDEARSTHASTPDRLQDVERLLSEPSGACLSLKATA